MRKLLFFCILSVVLSVNAFAQYPYYPYGGSDASPYSVPDANIQSAVNTLNMAGLQGVDLINGLWARDFDQVDATGSSIFANDTSKTFGINTTLLTDAGGGQIRGWSTVGGPFSAVRMNANPQIFNQPGIWAYYTINFTQAGKYKLLYRQRNANSAPPRNINGAIYDFSIHSFDNFPAAIKTMNTIDFTINNNWTVPGDVADNGTAPIDMLNGYVTYIADPQTTKGGQVGSVWLMVNDEIEITNPGKYVLKVNNKHTGANAAGTIGSMSFLQTEKYPVASFALTSNIGSATVMQDSSQTIIFTLKNNGPDGITGDMFVDFASANIAVSSSNSNFSGTKWTIPGGLANGASANVEVKVIPEVLGSIQIVPQITSNAVAVLGPHSAVTITINSIEPFVPVVPVSLWVVIAAFGGLFGMNILRRKRKRK
jgi:hypothetical protein